MKTDVKPYFVPSDESVTASPWLRQVDGELEPLGETIENWDYRTEVHLRCAVTIDAVKVRAQSGLTDGSPPISLVLGYRALDTYLAGAQHGHPSVRRHI